MTDKHIHFLLFGFLLLQMNMFKRILCGSGPGHLQINTEQFNLSEREKNADKITIKMSGKVAKNRSEAMGELSGQHGLFLFTSSC